MRYFMKENYKVGIVKYTDHASLNRIEAGAKNCLNDLSKKYNIKIDFENYIYDIIVSINNNGNCEEIVNKYVEMGYDMKRMYGISKEVSSDDIKKLTKKIEKYVQ